MNQEKIDISKMLFEVGATAEIIGVAKLTELLKDIQKQQKEITQEEYERAMDIISIVCENFQISVEDFYSTKRKNNRRYAVGSVVFILNKKYGFDYRKINFITKKSFTVISTLIKEIEQMSPSHPFDKKTLTILDSILTQLENN